MYYSKPKTPVMAIILTCVVTQLIALNIGIDRLWGLGAIHSSIVLSGEYYRLITALFIHSGITHLVMNMLTLVLTGNYLVEEYGNLKFLFIYALTGILSGLGVLYLAGPNTLTAGASGALYGLFGYIIVRQHYEQRLNKDWLKSNIILILLTNMIPGISVIGHISGLLAGVVLGYMGAKTHKVRRKKYPKKKPKGGGVGIAAYFKVGIVVIVFYALLTLFSSYIYTFLWHLDLPGKLLNTITKVSSSISESQQATGPKQTDESDASGDIHENSEVLTRHELEEKLKYMPIEVGELKFKDILLWDWSDYTEGFYEIDYTNVGTDDILDIELIIFEWDASGMPIEPNIGIDYFQSYANHLYEPEVNIPKGSSGVLQGRYNAEYRNTHKYKVIPFRYRTYGSKYWENPYIANFLEVYAGQRYVE